MKKQIGVIAAALVISGLLLNGCGGGGKSGSPAAPVARAGKGLVKMNVSFKDTDGFSRFLGSRKGSQTSEPITVNIVITGIYSVNGTEFPPVTATIQIDPNTGKGTASISEVPVGANHVLKATANFSTGSETVLGLIQEVAEAESTSGIANPYTTPAVQAMQSLAKSLGKNLSDLQYSQYETYQSQVQALVDAGFSVSEITGDKLLEYESVSGVPATVSVTPTSAGELAPGDEVKFTAVVKDSNGAIISTTVTWTTTGGIGTIDGDGLFVAQSAGEGTVTASAGSVSGSATVSGCPVGCTLDSECDDQISATNDVCTNAGTCAAACVSSECANVACTADTQCDDMDANGPTTDVCQNPGACDAICVNAACTPACSTDKDCDDSSGLTLDVCTDGGTCAAACDNSTAIACTTDADCDDSDPNTTDACSLGGSIEASCSNAQCSAACAVATDCDDMSGYTLDVCTRTNDCDAACDNSTPIACTTDADCDDGIATTIDACASGGTVSAACSHTSIACATDADCDDGKAITMDVCDAGGTLQSVCANKVLTFVAELDYPNCCSWYFKTAALSNDGATLYLGGQYTNQITPFDTVNMTFGTPIDTSIDIYGLAADPSRDDKLYAVGGYNQTNPSDTMSVIDLTSQSEVQTVPISINYAYGPAVSASADKLYVWGSNGYSSGINLLAEVDLSTLQVVQTIDTPSYTGYFGALDDLSARLFVPVYSNYSAGGVYDIDLSSLSVTQTLPQPAGYFPNCCNGQGSVLDSDNGLLYTVHGGQGEYGNGIVEVIDLNTEAVTQSINLSGYGNTNSLALVKRAGHVLAGSNGTLNILDSNSLLESIWIPSLENGSTITTITADNSSGRVYVTSQSKIAIFAYDVAGVEIYEWDDFEGGAYRYWYDGNDLYIIVRDPAANMDAGMAETVDVVVQNTTTLESELFTLTETGVDTGVFDGRLPTQNGSVAGADNDGILDAQYDDYAEATYTTGAGAARSASIHDDGGAF